MIRDRQHRSRPAPRAAFVREPHRDVVSRPDGVADEALIRSLYQQHGRALIAYASRLMPEDRSGAEDVVQETLLRAWRNPESLFNGRGSVRGWLFTVARNVVIDRVRARAARPGEVAETPYNRPIEADHAQGVVDSMVLMEALELLSPEHRQVLMEIYYHGRSTTEAAEHLRLPVGTVKSRTYYALRVLRAAATGQRPAVPLAG